MRGTIIKVALMAIICAGLVAIIQRVTEPQIVHQRLRYENQQRAQVLPATEYDSPLHEITAGLEITPTITGQVYLAKKKGQPRAALIEWVTPDGYNGDIRLLMAVSVEGVILGVRVLSHRETPGLGDRIEHDKSDWIDQWIGHSAPQPNDPPWQPDRLGGQFDTISSATITSSAVTVAIESALLAYQQHRIQLWSSIDEE